MLGLLCTKNTGTVTHMRWLVIVQLQLQVLLTADKQELYHTCDMFRIIRDCPGNRMPVAVSPCPRQCLNVPEKIKKSGIK